jgi:hypothetical protein
VIFLALIVGHSVSRREDEAQNADVHPEEFEANEVHKSEETPDDRSEVVYAPKNKRICCTDFFFSIWVVITFEDPFLLAELVDVRPPPEVDEESARHIFHCPKIHSCENDDKYEDHHFIADKQIEEQETIKKNLI